LPLPSVELVRGLPTEPLPAGQVLREWGRQQAGAPRAPSTVRRLLSSSAVTPSLSPSSARRRRRRSTLALRASDPLLPPPPPPPPPPLPRRFTRRLSGGASPPARASLAGSPPRRRSGAAPARSALRASPPPLPLPPLPPLPPACAAAGCAPGPALRQRPLRQLPNCCLGACMANMYDGAPAYRPTDGEKECRPNGVTWRRRRGSAEAQRLPRGAHAGRRGCTRAWRAAWRASR